MMQVCFAILLSLGGANAGGDHALLTTLQERGDDALNFTSLCSDAKRAGLSHCEEAKTPEAQGWSGGFCLASVAEAGWLRSSVINPVMALALATSLSTGILPLVTASNSGGSLFAVRYFSLRLYASATNWNYPCYLLQNPFLNVCYFHAGFGAVSGECEAERFAVVGAAISKVYTPLCLQYGGPLGVASLYLSVYFPFLAGLPIAPADMEWHAFAKKYVLFNTVFSLPSNWLVAHTLDDPIQASRGLNTYNYGFDSYLSRAVRSYMVKGNDWSIYTGQENFSVVSVAAASANVQSGFVLNPFAFAGKSWDGMIGTTNAPLKMQAMIVSYIMVKRLIRAHSILNDPGCKEGCPLLDGGFTDNGPITQIIQASVEIFPHRPPWVSSIGAASTMANIQYLMGSGPMQIFTFAGVNICPFTVGGLCTMISKLRNLVIGILPQKSQSAYYSLGNAYGVYRPDIQLMAPYCGDPLTYDLFDGRCSADSVCDMWTTIIPSEINQVAFTMDVYVIVFVMAFLQRTPVSARFVMIYMPQSMWDLAYYEHMDEWFPMFDAAAPAKGGVGFTPIAGNAFLDYMTYLNIRLVGYLFGTKYDADEMVSGTPPMCNFNMYQTVAKMTLDQPTFLAAEAMREVPNNDRFNRGPDPLTQSHEQIDVVNDIMNPVIGEGASDAHKLLGEGPKIAKQSQR